MRYSADMRTTIDINDAVLAALRERARQGKRPFREIVDEALALGLAQQMRAPTKPRFHVKPRKLGLKPGFHHVSLNQLYDQMEAEEDGRGK